MSTVSKKIKPVPLNKKNALAFADRLFSDKNGEVKLVKLCFGRLTEKDGRQLLHCAIGEAYANFVSPRFSITDPDEAIAAIVDRAQFKRNSSLNKVALINVLSDIMDANDQGVMPEEDYYQRARKVSAEWRKYVVPLLK